MTATAATRLVAGREIRERLQGRLIRVMTVLTAVLVVGIIVIPAIARRPAKPAVVGLVGAQAQALAPALRSLTRIEQADVTVLEVADAAAARAQLARGSLTVALSVGPDSAVALSRQAVPPTLTALLQATVDQAHLRQVLRAAGVPLATIARASAPVPFSASTIQPARKVNAARDAAALAAGVLLYVSLGIYGAAVANGVAQEKTSRTAEVLLAAVRPGQLLTGKVAGIGLCGFGQLGVAVAAGLAANAAVRGAQIPATVWVLLPALLLWFVLGFALYAFAFAAAGAIVARQEEVQFVTMPLALPLVVGFFLVYAAIANPGAWWIAVLSFLPPLAPILMPARIALGHLAAWQMPTAVLIMVAAIYGMARVSARVYTGALVRSGARLSWRDALRLRRQ